MKLAYAFIQIGIAIENHPIGLGAIGKRVCPVFYATVFSLRTELGLTCTSLECVLSMQLLP